MPTARLLGCGSSALRRASCSADRMAIRRLHIDPAVVSAPLITTLVDGTGLFIYFPIAQIVLGLD